MNDYKHCLNEISPLSLKHFFISFSCLKKLALKKETQVSLFCNLAFSLKNRLKHIKASPNRS